jgi:hypothetical protein
MIFIGELNRAPTFDSNRHIPQVVVDAKYSGRQDPTQENFLDFVFDQTTIPLEGGNHNFKLLKPLVLRINHSTLRFTVTDWGIEMDCGSLGQLPREIARRFLQLLSGAENESLSEADQAHLLRIADYVDFQQFSINRSAPRYMEGKLISNAENVIVLWHDGSREQIDHNVAKTLSEVNVGEQFSAFVKLGKDDKSRAIERVSLLSESKENEDWESWPKKN